ncbi:MAG: MFS transporter, partial [Thermodesulfobacteriota bacterium]
MPKLLYHPDLSGSTRFFIFYGGGSRIYPRPLHAPIIGGWLLALIGWRSIFWFMMTVAIVLCVLAWITLPETLPIERRQSFAPAPLARGYWSVLSDSRFLLLTIASGVPFNAMFIFILSAPTLLGKHL